MLISLRLIFVLLFSFGLLSCSANDGQSRIELPQPDSIRQALVYNSSNLQVRISINGGADQTFNLDGSAASSVVSVSGIQPGEENQISIIWVELVDGQEIEISMQQQSFFADNNTIIDAPHSYSAFDYDGDSISNFNERLDGSCVWQDEVCSNGFQTETPSINNSENLLLNGDFSMGNDFSWYYSGDNPQFSQGEFCITSPVSAVNYENSYIGHTALVSVEGGRRYVFSFKVKATASAPAHVIILTKMDDEFGQVLDIRRTVSTSYQTIAVSYSPVIDRSNLIFAVNIGANSDVRFCFDDMSLLVVE